MSTDLTTNDVQRTKCDLRENIKALPFELRKIFYKNPAVLIKDLDKLLENLEVECRRDDFTTSKPFLSR